MADQTTHSRFRPALAVALALLGGVGGDLAAQPPITVGRTGTLEAVVLPGTELEAAPLADRARPVVVRVVRTYPHGTAYRYDLEYSALEPGTHDLRPYLRRKDGSPLGELPPLTVEVKSVLPAGLVKPHALEIAPGPRVGGYRTLVVIAVAVWAVGLLALLASFVWPRRRAAGTVGDKPVSLAERLRPLVEGAVAGTLSRAELAGLERALLAYWRKRLSLEGAEPEVAFGTMRADPDAGPLLAKLEAWLHRPGSPDPVDVPALLAPYRDLSPDALDPAGGAP